jgi:SCP-2 sterol transfer family protein
LVRWVSRRIGATKRERLERAMRGPRRRAAILWVLFKAMPHAIRRRALEREQAVIEWRISGRRDGGHDVRQLVIEDGEAFVLPGDKREENLILIVDGVALILLATGNASGPNQFVAGNVDIKGDPWLAMRLPNLFAAGERSRSSSR